MLTTYQRMIEQRKVTRTGGVTYDNRDPYGLIRQLQAEVEVLRARVRAMETAEGLRRGERSDPQEPRRGDHNADA